MAINKKSKKVDLYNSWHASESIKDLRDWLDAKIKEGDTKFELDISWGYYNDIDAINLVTRS
jgi:hypothetical protein